MNRKWLVLLLTVSLLSIQSHSSAENGKLSKVAEEDQALINDLDFLEMLEMLEENELDFIDNDEEIIKDMNNDGGKE